MEVDYREEVSEFLEMAISEKGISITGLAKEIQVDRKTIYNWKKHGSIPLHFLPTITKALHPYFDVLDFLNYCEEKELPFATW